jgi:hypothetical protein
MNESPIPSSSAHPSDATKKLSRCISHNMAPQAILDRLQAMSDLSNFCYELGQSKRIGKASELLENPATTDSSAISDITQQ